jgi:hypothetical protein
VRWARVAPLTWKTLAELLGTCLSSLYSNPHSYFEDFLQEAALYSSSGALVRLAVKFWLENRNRNVGSLGALAGLAKELGAQMATAGLWDESHVALTDAWFQDLAESGYSWNM